MFMDGIQVFIIEQSLTVPIHELHNTRKKHTTLKSPAVLVWQKEIGHMHRFDRVHYSEL